MVKEHTPLLGARVTAAVIPFGEEALEKHLATHTNRRSS